MVKRIVNSYRGIDPNKETFDRNTWGVFNVMFVDESGKKILTDIFLTSEDLGENISKTTNLIGDIISKVNGTPRSSFDEQKFFDKMVDDLDFWDFQTRMMVICSYGYELGCIDRLNLDEDGFITGFETKRNPPFIKYCKFLKVVEGMMSPTREELMYKTIIEMRNDGMKREMVG